MTTPNENQECQEWITVGALEDIPLLGARIVETASGKPIALFRTAGDGVKALLDRCPHKGGPLSQGIVHGERVTCPLHSWQIDLASGQAIAPDVGCAKSFATKLQDGRVFLKASDLL